MNILKNNRVLQLLTTFFRGNSIIKQQIISFNDFIRKESQHIIDKIPNLVIQISYKNSNKIVNRILLLKQLYTEKPRIIKTRELYNLVEPSYDEGELNISPNKSRLRNITYSSKVRIQVFDEITDKHDANLKKKVVNKSKKFIYIGKFPCMIKSDTCYLNNFSEISLARNDECPFDEGGYFIINGNEKVLVAQERLVKNKVYIFSKIFDKKTRVMAQCRSYDSSLYNQGYMVYLKLVTDKSNNPNQCSEITVKIASLRAEIPLVILLKFLGFKNDKEIINSIFKNNSNSKKLNMLYNSFLGVTKVQTISHALRYIVDRSFSKSNNKKLDPEKTAREIIDKKLLPHMGTSINSRFRKGLFICYMAHRLINTLNEIEQPDDKDSYKNKRVDISGHLFSSLFNNLIKRSIKDVKNQLLKKVKKSDATELEELFSSNILTNGFRYSLATGNWIIDGMLDYKTGVSQVLNRMSYLSMISHLSRLNSSYTSNGKILDIRRVHTSYWGIVCPVETPEGQTCGIVKNFAFLAHVTNSHHIQKNIIQFLKKIMIKNSFTKPMIKTKKDKPDISIFVNGSWIGNTFEYFSLMKYLITLRRQEIIPFDVSIVFNEKNKRIFIWSDPGRIKRPLFVLKNSNSFFNHSIEKIAKKIKDNFHRWYFYIKNSIVEYLDTEEIENIVIKLNYYNNTELIVDQTQIYKKMINFSEIHASSILGVSASQVPFSQHNQSPRNTYQSSMGKQAIGINYSNFQLRYDTQINILESNQRPLVFTIQKLCLRGQEMPSGINTIMAILSYSGFNQEDSLIINHSSVERGLFRTIIYKTFAERENTNVNGIIEKIELESKSSNLFGLDIDGTRKIETLVNGDDVLISKTIKLTGKGDTKVNTIHSDLKLPLNSQGVVDSIMYSLDEGGYKIIKVRIRSIREPVIGDKFSSLHGQKGIIGYSYRQSLLPTTATSVTPDLIMNPHAIPSRMTIGHMIEMLMSKVSSHSGKLGDATAFSEGNIGKIIGHLSKFGIHHFGLEKMISGFNGDILQKSILVGPIYYQRLKHMVVDKFFSRSRGPYEILTRQPVEGKTREGGLRFGEMERDCVLSHGSSLFLKERLMDESDKFRVHICEKSGLFCPANLKTQTFWSTIYHSKSICQIFIPYACKLLFQELIAMCIAPRLVVK
ncbi:RBP2 DNA-directed RNA polymerase II second largest subunit (nucleomorph) [Bigelowiella natans]|uniref:DNA-directed RNA polymerase subunit beta n=1 Tax=Bigelowiella natans TaxID=227086 RepID=Q3LW27_BIGNA|nr:RBP2 DNA-directed RNA polymerase II second largest subunit [Bigelowiella natans]ABA27338.1 RBP2 DNA-directed RNA polymerase II second largest subunit [Bigelowiella natans]